MTSSRPRLRGLAGDQVATCTGLVIGTPQYLSPEQAMPSRKAESDGRLDLYSLGIVLYELLTGSIPFHSDTPMGIIVQHLHAEPVPPHELSPERRIPPELSAVVLRALEKDPQKGFASADEMRLALESWPSATLARPLGHALRRPGSAAASLRSRHRGHPRRQLGWAP